MIGGWTRAAGLARWAVALLVLATGATAVGQEVAPCGAPPKVLLSAQPNIFNDEQEQWLGEAISDRLEREYRPVKDPAENEYLKTIGDRLLSVLPPTKMQFHFLLIDSPEINGLSLAGGRVYLTRKLVANARTEDEVAGVMAHEMGHLLTHQVAIETTADLRRLLGVTSVGDRGDVYAKFQQLMDARMRDKHPPRTDEDEKQDVADRVAVYAAAAAGYRAQAYAEFWDRSFFVKGKTGNAFSDFFGSTKPTEKRLREMRKLTAGLPPGCGASAGVASAEFGRWHNSVVANQARETQTEEAARASKAGDGTGGASEVRLTPPLRMDIEQLRFSRDGKLLLAQDEGSVLVLSREPFRVLFRMDAERALPAKFSPDSTRVVFSTPDLHVEEWGVAEQKLLAAHELTPRKPCIQAEVSPDGRTMLCMGWNDDSTTLDLDLLDVDTGNVVFQKKAWFVPNFSLMLGLMLNQQGGGGASLVPIAFSADGNTVLTGFEDTKLSFDLRTRTPIKLSGQLKSWWVNDYVFAGSDRLVAVNTTRSSDSGMLSFPEGRLLKRMDLPFPNMEAVTHGDYVLVHNLKDYAVGLADLNAGKFLLGSQALTMDVWQDMSINEETDGSLLLANTTKQDAPENRKIMLPLSPLGAPATAELSPDGRYLAMSTRTRGGVWDVSTGKRMFLVRGFQNAWWVDRGRLMVELKAYLKQPAQIAEFVVEPKSAKPMPYALEKGTHMARGRLLVWKDQGKKHWRLEVHDASTNAVAWTRTFAGDQPAFTENLTGGELIFSFPLRSEEGQVAVKADAALQGAADAVHAKDAGRVVEVVDAATGTVAQKTVVEVPRTYVGVGGASRLGDLLYVQTSDNRTVVYSLTTGRQLRQMFGAVVAADVGSERVCAANRRGEAVIYDRSGNELKHLRLESPLRFASLRNGGKSLVVLTADQRVRQFGVEDAAPSVAKAAATQ